MLTCFLNAHSHNTISFAYSYINCWNLLHNGSLLNKINYLATLQNTKHNLLIVIWSYHDHTVDFENALQDRFVG